MFKKSFLLLNFYFLSFLFSGTFTGKSHYELYSKV